MSILDQWFLGDPIDLNGQDILGWNFTMCKKYQTISRIMVNIKQSGRPLDYSLGGLSVPYIESQLANKMLSIDPTAAQIFPVSINDFSKKYVIFNVLRALEIEHSDSEIDYYTPEDIKNDPELAGSYHYVRKLVVNDKKVPTDAHIFRLKKFDVMLIVDDLMKSIMEMTSPQSGAKFTPLDVR